MTARRDRWVFRGLAAGMLVAAVAAYLLLLGPGPAVAPPPPSPPAPEPVRLAVGRAEGVVSIVRAGASAAAQAGDLLLADDVIVTAPGARVALAGGGYEVVLEEGGRFGVEEIAAELSRFRLEAGLVSAQVAPGAGSALEIASGADAVTRTRGGELSVARSGEVTAVAVASGEAEVASAGRTVVLRGGQQSLARAGQPPTAPQRIPASLLLKVSWPDQLLTNQRRMVVRGRTAPGALVVLGGERVLVGPDGRFTQVVVLAEGRQHLSARAQAVGGLRAVSQGPPIVLDTRAPDAQFDTRDLWTRPKPK